jgi:uncharacterized protein YndB with AHSA1/START domain
MGRVLACAFALVRRYPDPMKYTPPLAPAGLRGLAAWACAAVLPWAVANPVHADTSQVSASGFVSSYREEVKASTDEVWRAIVQLPRWWNGQHTWSGNAANLSLDAQAGGCWCERWGDGASAQHGQVLMVQPGRVIILQARLGPLLDKPVQAVLTLVTSVQDGKTLLRLNYQVAGGADAGLDKLATPVDQVLGLQFQRLKRLVETGQPE